MCTHWRLRVDAARYGIQTLAPKFFWGAKPEFVVSGPNIGSKRSCIRSGADLKIHSVLSDNLGTVVLISGTVCV